MKEVFELLGSYAFGLLLGAVIIMVCFAGLVIWALAAQ